MFCRKIDFNDFLDIIISKQGSDRDIHSEIMQVSLKISLQSFFKLCALIYLKGCKWKPWKEKDILLKICFFHE